MLAVRSSIGSGKVPQQMGMCSIAGSQPKVRKAFVELVGVCVHGRLALESLRFVAAFRTTRKLALRLWFTTKS